MTEKATTNHAPLASSVDWADRAAADCRELNPDYSDWETEAAKLIRAQWESARASDARLTDSESGTAIGSARESSSSKTGQADPSREESLPSRQEEG